MNRDSKGSPTLPPSPSQDGSQNTNTLADAAKRNPSALGDPVSLKNESSDSSPTEHDKPNQGPSSSNNSGSQKDHETLSQKALKNPTALGDPVSLKAEQSTLIPKEEERGSENKRDTDLRKQ
ncbi:MAG: hypothetical protein Q9162_002045 [Coniocarpon cinnabarinum]